MSEHTMDDAERLRLIDNLAGQEPIELVSRIVVSDDRVRECTICPPQEADVERSTTWLTAREGSFVELAEMR